MTKYLNMRTVSVAAALIGLSATGAYAQATDLSSMVDDQLDGQLNSLGNLAGMVAFLAGFLFGIMGFMKLRANAQNPQDPSNKVSTAFMLMFIGAGLIAVPTVMGIGVMSLFGGPNANGSTTLDGGGGFTEIK